MNIVHVISSLDSSSGGPPIVAGALSSCLASLGNNVTLIGGASSENALAIKQMPGMEKVRLIEYRKEKFSINSFIKRYVYKLLANTGPYDVIHFHGVWCIELWQVALVAKLTSAKLVITPHGMLDNWSLKQNRIIKKIALFLYVRKIFNNAFMIHALNEHEKKCVLNLRIKTKVRIIGNGIFKEYMEQKNRDITKNNLVEGEYFLFLSRLHYKKGLDCLAKAWIKAKNTLKDAKLIVAGPRDDNSIDLFNSLIKNEGLQSTVEIIQPVYGLKKFELLRNAIAFVLPSRQEGFSMAIVESLSQGTPVIITEACNFPEVKESNSGVVCSFDENEIAKSMVYIYQNLDKAKEMSKNGVQLISKSYTWDKISQKMELCYLDVS